MCTHEEFRENSPRRLALSAETVLMQCQLAGPGPMICKRGTDGYEGGSYGRGTRFDALDLPIDTTACGGVKRAIAKQRSSRLPEVFFGLLCDQVAVPNDQQEKRPASVARA